MPPTIVLIRHAQALHNDHSIHDPPLTDLGIQQCAALRKSLMERFSSAQSVAVVASPMRRTMQTAVLAADWLVERGVRIQADADWQENSDHPCDTGSPIPFLTADFPPHLVDFSTVDPLWPGKSSPSARPLYGYTRGSILERGRRCLEKLYRRPESLILVFSHSAFLRTGVVGWWFFNGDYRIFDFESESESGEARRALRQDEGTVAGGLGLSWVNRVELGSDLPDDEGKSASDAVESTY